MYWRWSTISEQKRLKLELNVEFFKKDTSSLVSWPLTAGSLFAENLIGIGIKTEIG